MIKMIVRNCVICGKSFAIKKFDQECCSQKCIKKNKRKSRKNINKTILKTLAKMTGQYEARFQNLEEQIKAFGIEMDRIEQQFKDHLNAPTEAELDDLARSGGI